ncbi:MAG: hypothetical protein COB59_11870 [Rhodospirillaceae bacterium]|nr:MAG: hypothetical protein COB59_11870 [Rhodospirillaceae bacterium]
MQNFTPLKLFNKNACGAAAVEFALISPVVLLMILGAVDFGFIVHNSMQATSASRSGAQFVLEDPTGYSANIITVVQSATNLPSASVSVTTSEECRCLGSSTAVNCSTDTCSGNSPPKYVTITTSYNYDLIMGYPGLPDPWPISKSAIVRVPSE